MMALIEMKITNICLFSLMLTAHLCVRLTESIPIINQNLVTIESCDTFLRSLEKDPTHFIFEFGLKKLRNTFNKCSSLMNAHGYQSAEYYRDDYQTNSFDEDSYEYDDIDV